MSNYLITGLPRSKLAWMSVVASTIPGSMCWHGRPWEECAGIWRDARYGHRGVADSNLLMHVERFLTEANPRILVIRRDAAQVKESLFRIGPEIERVDRLSLAIDRFISNPAIAWAPFETLNQVPVVRQCLQFLMPGCEPDDARIAQLIELNVEPDRELLWARALYAVNPVNLMSDAGLAALQ